MSGGEGMIHPPRFQLHMASLGANTSGWWTAASAEWVRTLETRLLALEIDFLEVKRQNANLRALVSDQMLFYENERDRLESK